MANFVLVLLASSFITAQAAELSATSHANPIRKVVTMLQNMAKKAEAEGKKQTELYDKFMCYCQTGRGDLEKSIADAKTKIPELESAIEASAGKKTQLEKDLDQHKADRAAAKTAMGEATAVRNKESASFKKEAAEDKAEAATLQKALTSLEGGLGAAFLQTKGAESLRKIVKNQDMDDGDRQTVLSFLSGAQGEAAPGTETIVGILKTMKEEMASGLAEAETAEKEAVATFDSLMGAKKKEVKAATRMTEEKLQRVGQLATEIETAKNELEDTSERLAEDSKMLSTLEKSCATKEEEFKKAQAVRQEELVALADTIKILNDDDALELFKKTLPGSSASFLQIPVSAQAVRNQALSFLQSARPRKHGSVQLDFIALALRGKKVGFDGVIKMIDELAGTLRAEQAADDKKKVYCGEEFDKSEDKKKSLERSISDTKSAIGKANEDIASLAEAIEKLTAGIKELDKSVAEATTQRKEENTEYTALMASDGTAKEVLKFAKNRLNKFYNPKLYKAPPKRELSEEDRITVNMGGTLAPTAAPGGIAGTGISFMQLESHHKKQDSNGVIKMIDLLIADLDKEMTEAEVSEKDSQADYEKAMKDAQAKRATDSKALAESQSEKADLEASLEELTAAKKSAKKELMATDKYISTLHSECDWLLQYFDVRKEARTGEIDAMVKAKAVLSGADYSFLQIGSSKARGFLEP